MSEQEPPEEAQIPAEVEKADVPPPAVAADHPVSHRGGVGETRSIGLSILWAILTFGIYTYIWVFKTHKEMHTYTGNGVGGWLGFIIYFVFAPITWFLVPSEIKSMYEQDGRNSPVGALRGLWVLLPIIGALLLVHPGAGRAERVLGVEGRAGPVIEAAAPAPAGGEGRGPIGQTRSVPLSIVWAILTLGIYTYIWVYRTHKEIKEYSGQGVGGWLGLVIWIVFTLTVGLAGVITWFLIPSEIKTMIEAEGEESSVRGTTGLWWLAGWLIFGWFVWFIKVQGQLNRFWESKAAPAP